MLKFHVMLKCSTGWRRLIGSRKLHIIFHKRATRYRALLRKMTYKDKGPYESSPPCISQLAPMKCQDAHSSLLHNFSKVGPLLCFPYTRLHIRFSRIFGSSGAFLNLAKMQCFPSSKVTVIVIVYRKYSSDVIFEKVCKGGAF